MWSLDCEAKESIKAGQLVSHSHFLMVVLKHSYALIPHVLQRKGTHRPLTSLIQMLLNVEGFANLVKKVGKRDIEEGNGSDGNVAGIFSLRPGCGSDYDKVESGGWPPTSSGHTLVYFAESMRGLAQRTLTIPGALLSHPPPHPFHRISLPLGCRHL
ncbi:uncharacterized [Tachysurus ichikawai]